MKWIDDRDDYFLRDFNSKDDESSGRSDSPSDASGGTPSDPADDTSSPPASGSAGSDSNAPNEFTFPGQPGSDSDAGMTAGGADPAESPRRKRRRARRRLFWFFLILFIVLCTAFYIRYFVPYTSETLITGYVTLVEKRGIFFKTFEGEMISESMLADTSKVYSRDFFFSIPDDSLGRLVQSYQGTGRRVTLTTQKYYGTLPWRGSQKSVVTAVTPAN